MNILFLCRGNVGRSVLGEYLYNELAETAKAVSAGTQLSGPEETLEDLWPQTEFVLEVLAEENIDLE